MGPGRRGCTCFTGRGSVPWQPGAGRGWEAPVPSTESEPGLEAAGAESREVSLGKWGGRMDARLGRAGVLSGVGSAFGMGVCVPAAPPAHRRGLQGTGREPPAPPSAPSGLSGVPGAGGGLPSLCTRWLALRPGLCPSHAAPARESRGPSLNLARSPVSTLGFRTPNPRGLEP